MLEFMQLVPRVCSVLEKLMDRIPKEEMIEKYHSPEGLRVRVVIDDTEILAQIREKKPDQVVIPNDGQ